MRPIAPALGSYAFVTRLAMALLTIAVLSIAMPSMASGYSTGTSGALYDFVVPLRRKKKGGIHQFKVHDGLALRET